MLTARRLTLKLVKLVQDWKRLRLDKATFMVSVCEEPVRPTGLRSSSA